MSRNASNSASFSKPAEHELHHLAARLLHVAGVRAEEPDQRRVGQRREHEPGDEHHDERPRPDHPRRDDGRRLPELAELVDELRLRGSGAAARGLLRSGLRLGLGAAPRGGLGLGRWLGLGLGLGAWLRLGLGLGSGSGSGSGSAFATGSGSGGSGRWGRGRRLTAVRVVAIRGAPQFGQNRARSSS